MCNGIVTSACGIALLAIGIPILIYEPLILFANDLIDKELVLVEGTEGYRNWLSPPELKLYVYLFNVSNPDDVMAGATPKLVQHGPYVYTDKYEKEVLRIDEENDEIEYTEKRLLKFNKKLTGSATEDDILTIMNVAYLGTISTIATGFPSFMSDIGNNLPKLFPNRKSIFVKGRVKEILFEGLALTCNLKRFPELGMICGVLKTKRPPILSATDREGIYRYSFLSRMNGTVFGPYIAKRGVQNVSSVGDLVSANGKRQLSFWQTEECNRVSGSNTQTWPKLTSKWPTLNSYIVDACRTFGVTYLDDVVLKGIRGYRYTFHESIWSESNIACYCPLNDKKQPECLPTGLLDISGCQEAPVIMSEPHFLHGDPSLLEFAQGLNPKEELHGTFIILDPLTGAPLSGSKKLQLNMKLMNYGVDLLENVTTGYFPLIWFEQSGEGTQDTLRASLQAHRAINLINFLQMCPIIFGTFLLVSGLCLTIGGAPPTTRVIEATPVETVIRTPTARRGNLVQRNRLQAFHVPN